MNQINNQISNQITISEVPNIQIGKLATLAPNQLLYLQEQAEINLQNAKRLKDWLDSSISMKYRDIASNIRKLDYKDSGTIHFSDGDYKITSVVAKRIEWNQQKLKDVVSVIKEYGDNPSEYIEISYKVPETKYNAWPEHSKNIFKPARIFKLSKESFVISESKEVGNE
jgi:hypothetical protein